MRRQKKLIGNQGQAPAKNLAFIAELFDMSQSPKNSEQSKKNPKKAHGDLPMKNV